ncbi:MAG: thioesterase [Bacteroidetes bacterium]|nr:thioesterase [Bacteroidota bacterium]
MFSCKDIEFPYKCTTDKYTKIMHEKIHNVTSFEANNNLQLKLNCLFQWFSEIAWEHAKMLNVGFEDMDTTNLLWMLIGVKAKIKKLPKWQEKVILQTAPTGISGLYFSREFILKDKNYNVLVEADSKWLMLDKHTLKPIKSVENDYKNMKISETKLDFQFVRLKEKTELTNTYNETAKYTDIDLHQHTNNAVYVRWIENILENAICNKINTISIQFLKEVKQDDNVIINFSNVINNKVFFEAIIESTGNHCFRSEIELTD